ncbi:hypothetical protein ACTXT7_007331, partial [Hymenolepis weldensis]
KPIEVSINQNAIMPAWFDIYGLSVESPQDEKGIAKVAEQVKNIRSIIHAGRCGILGPLKMHWSQLFYDTIYSIVMVYGLGQTLVEYIGFQGNNEEDSRYDL